MTTFKEAQIIIGIDPDLDKSGVAVLKDGLLRLDNMRFYDLTQYFEVNKDQIKKVVIEAGWLNKKSNLHGRIGQSKRAGERIAKNVGENHATGKLLAEMAESLGLTVVLVKPTKSKKNSEEFNRITGWKGRTNQEQRDAGMLIWGVSGKKVA
ncbi:hypothetical protein [Acinetobacter baumannii]|uniref:hypothetical protein n=1 Tax=Acinetobacter baumannii TaxID=470 RepID=UPI00135F8F61|nr:hypothetical protein [Acinetobacter baumannii]MDC5100978.1 hypothetical protein [Acinetobacter baumannii]CAA0288949.1 hypothetical protein AB945B12_03937 [Acinetobacter baumannii]